MVATRHILSRVRHEEAGMGMLEVLVSALILAVISIGVLKTFDAASAQSGFNKSRAVGANLATEDLERLRGYRASQLTGLNETRTRPVNGVNYTVVSTATWLSDDSGSRSCTSDGKQIEYVKLTSKVTWPNIRNDSQAVSQTTLYAPPKGSFGTQGAMAIQVLDRNGVGVGGVAVSATATGLPTLSANTDTLGCAYFPYIATGTYSASISKTNYIDPAGASNPAATVGVSAENVTTQQFDFDQKGSIAGTVTTFRADAAGGAATTVPSGTVTLDHSQLDTPRAATLSASGTYSFTNVYPFTGTYYVSPGYCDGSASTPVPPGLQIAVAPLSANTGKDMVKPSVKVVANGNPGYTLAGVTVELSPTSATSGCADKTYYGKATAAGNANTSWWLSPSNAADVPGTSYKTADSTVPFGTFDACVSGKVVEASNALVYWKSTTALTDLTKVDTIPVSKDPYSSSNRTGYGTSASQVGC